MSHRRVFHTLFSCKKRGEYRATGSNIGSVCFNVSTLNETYPTKKGKQIQRERETKGEKMVFCFVCLVHVIANYLNEDQVKASLWNVVVLLVTN